MTDSPVRVAAIDLDETLIEGQSQQLFIRYLVRRRQAPLWLIAYGAFIFALYKAGFRLDYAALQQRAIRGFAGMPATTVDELCRDFAANDLPRHLCAGGRREIEELRRAGAALILISGAIEPLVAQIGAAIGIADVVATRVAPPTAGRFSGKIADGMLFGASKLEAVRRHADGRFGAGHWRLWRAYGDHDADLALLEAADEPIAVDPMPSLRAVAEARCWTIVTWR